MSRKQAFYQEELNFGPNCVFLTSDEAPPDSLL